MVCRAVPKFLDDINISEDVQVSNRSFYFNYGRSALQFFLECLREFEGRKLKIGLQAFNCIVVNDAVIDSGNETVYLDINLVDFSVSLDQIAGKEMDVLILTHYQGLRNISYNKIVEYCSRNNIVLIDDIAQSEFVDLCCTVSHNFKVSLHSYAFDKPLSSLFGGKLHLTNCPRDFLNLFRTKYAMLPLEKEAVSRNHLRLLFKLKELCSASSYRIIYSKIEFMNFLFQCFPSMKTFEIILKSHFLLKLLYRFYHYVKREKKQIMRMNPAKVQFIECQRMSADLRLFNVLPFIEKFGLNVDSVWVSGFEHVNRLPLLTYDAITLDKLEQSNFEYGVFNWPQLVSSDGKYYPNSVYAANNLLLLPVWQKI